MVQSLIRRDLSRVLPRMVCVAAAGACVWTSAGAAAQATLVRSLLTAPEVIAAMHDRRMPTDGVEVRLAAAVTSSVAKPALEIRSIVPLNAHDVRIRVACRNGAECLPFFAFATYSRAVDPAAFSSNSEPRPATISRTTPGTPVIDAARPASQGDNGTVATVRSGSPATLDFDEERVHVRVDVICLESGASGDRIHVTTRGRKQVYQAEIVSAGILKGTLTR